MSDQINEAPVISDGERRIRRGWNRPALALTRGLQAALAAFVLLVLVGAVHSLWTIHVMRGNQQTVEIAARLDQQIQRMVERAEHYRRVAPRNYPDFFRDVELYYAELRDDLGIADSLVADLERRDAGFDPDLWNRFRNDLEQSIGDDADRPRLEWAADHVAEDGLVLLAATGELQTRLRESALRSQQTLWWSSTALAAATLVLAFLITLLFRKRVLNRVEAVARTVRRMTDGDFQAVGPTRAADELGQLEAEVAKMARRTTQLAGLLDRLNGAGTLQEAIDRIPSGMRTQFDIEWLGVVEVHDNRVRLRTCKPSREEMGIEQPATGWTLSGSLLADARRSGHAVFQRLRNADGDRPLEDALLVQLRDSGMVSAAMLPVRVDHDIDAGVLLASRNPDAFIGWRGRWLQNVGHLIAQALYRSAHVEQLGISMVRGLAELAEKRDPTTGQHLERMQRYAGRIARRMVELGHVDTRRSPRFAEQVEAFAPLHDIGKVGISDTILLKPGALTAPEIAEIRRHPQIGAEVLMAAAAKLGAEGEKLLAHATDIALYHHEKYDGSGYPHGLVGDAIPMSARIVAVADVFDALTSKRPYKKAWSEARALEYLDTERGRHFDPAVVGAFHDCLADIRRVRELFADRVSAEASTPG